jgi:hypothetical protein
MLSSAATAIEVRALLMIHSHRRLWRAARTQVDQGRTPSDRRAACCAGIAD